MRAGVLSFFLFYFIFFVHSHLPGEALCSCSRCRSSRAFVFLVYFSNKCMSLVNVWCIAVLLLGKHTHTQTSLQVQLRFGVSSGIFELEVRSEKISVCVLVQRAWLSILSPLASHSYCIHALCVHMCMCCMCCMCGDVQIESEAEKLIHGTWTVWPFTVSCQLRFSARCQSADSLPCSLSYPLSFVFVVSCYSFFFLSSFFFFFLNFVLLTSYLY